MKPEHAYFSGLKPRQQLNDLMHKFAQANGDNYANAWAELDRRWKLKYGDKLSWLRWKYNQEHGTNLTIPAYIESTGKLSDALIIAHGMIEL